MTLQSESKGESADTTLETVLAVAAIVVLVVDGFCPRS
jgi:hypothetical protein